MFEREHHRRMAKVLEALDAERMLVNGCLFAGGTAMAMRYGEYRRSADIDFLVCRLDGYRQLRQLIVSTQSINALAKAGAGLSQIREVRADQYGIRTMLQVDDAPIKFEIILEGRIELDEPGEDDRVCGVATLTPLDMVASKLLANSDRWRDDSVLSRDLIDLAMMAPPKKLLRQAMEKAARAYGQRSIEDDLAKAVQDLRDRPQRLDQCMRELDMADLPKAALWARIKALAVKIQ